MIFVGAFFFVWSAVCAVANEFGLVCSAFRAVSADPCISKMFGRDGQDNIAKVYESGQTGYGARVDVSAHYFGWGMGGVRISKVCDDGTRSVFTQEMNALPLAVTSLRVTDGEEPPVSVRGFVSAFIPDTSQLKGQIDFKLPHDAGDDKLTVDLYQCENVLPDVFFTLFTPRSADIYHYIFKGPGDGDVIFVRTIVSYSDLHYVQVSVGQSDDSGASSVEYKSKDFVFSRCRPRIF